MSKKDKEITPTTLIVQMVLMFILGWLIGSSCEVSFQRQQAIDNNAAYYNQQTGDFQYGCKQKECKQKECKQHN